ncbi:hypothetical protein K501DRAFT_192277 [Backusella circina FSU 941]|nr:hypothetical protein K501DRAFT_192277 [Backusella circina FSU 941]
MTDYNEIFYKLCQYIISWIFKVTVSIYFKEIKIGGTHNIPKTGPVIYVIGPHSNQFIDPVLIIQSCQREVSFLCAEKSIHEPGVGLFLRMFRPIRVNRPQDNAVSGEGRLKSMDSCQITGINTKFTKQLNTNDYISFPKGYGEFKVVNIISDTECIVDLDTESSDPKKLSTLFKDSNSRVAYRCMPHIEQEAVYKKVHAELNQNGAIGIFPEGGSHDRTQLLPLKGGVTVMAMGAMAKYKDLDVKIVPCGISYSQAHQFRSRVGIEFGDPITISRGMIEDFKAGGEAKRKSCATLLDFIQEGLKAVTVNVKNYETLKFIKATRRIYSLSQKKLDIFEQKQIDRRLSIGYNQFQNHSKVVDIHRRIIAHQHILKYYHIKDYQIPQTIYRGSTDCLKIVVNSTCFLLLLLLSAPGIILNIPVAMAVDYISGTKAKSALKKSTVKIYGRDVISTWKIISSYILLPISYAFYTFAVSMHLKDKDIVFKYRMLAPIAVWCLLPYISFLSVLLYEKSQDFKRSITPLFLAIFDQKTAKILRENHHKLFNEVTEVVNEYKTQVFPDIYNNGKGISFNVYILNLPSFTKYSSGF